jgi:regulator of protease activity HflC (stomatin/prohibitin superfamily)
MNEIFAWMADQYRQFKAFAWRQAPYVFLLFVLLVFAVIFFFDSMVISIHPGELGVLWRRLGGTQIDTVYREGLHFILPINKMYIYNVRKKRFTEILDVLTEDGLSIKVQYSARYALEKDTLPVLHQRVGPDFENVVVLPEVRAVIRSVLGQYKPEEIYTSQRAIQEAISSVAKVRMAARFVTLDDVPLESIKLPTKITEAIEAKMAHQQLEKEYEFRLSVARKEAERRRIESEGLRIYNDTVNSSLSPAVLTWQGIQATLDLAKSSNAKVVVVGSGKDGLPLILKTE